MRREVESPTPAWLTRTQRDLKRLGWFYHYDLSAVMGFPRLHLLDQDAWGSLLPGLAEGAAALDVGAGSGQLLREFSPLLDTVVATELSTPLLWRLRLEGAHAIKADSITRDSLGEWWAFDVVFVHDFHLDLKRGKTQSKERVPLSMYIYIHIYIYI